MRDKHSRTHNRLSSSIVVQLIGMANSPLCLSCSLQYEQHTPVYPPMPVRADGQGYRVLFPGQALDFVRHPRGRTPFIVLMLRFATPLGSAEKVQMVTPERVTQR